jgi:hypothetical protein
VEEAVVAAAVVASAAARGVVEDLEETGWAAAEEAVGADLEAEA